MEETTGMFEYWKIGKLGDKETGIVK